MTEHSSALCVGCYFAGQCCPEAVGLCADTKMSRSVAKKLVWGKVPCFLCGKEVRVSVQSVMLSPAAWKDGRVLSVV